MTIGASRHLGGPPDSGGAGGGGGSKPVKKVFTNWGGEFFKKNLDYRANTNKILEKMNLGGGGGGGGAANNAAPSAVGAASVGPGAHTVSSSSLPNFIPGERFRALLGGSTSSSSTVDAASAKKFKSNHPSYTNSYL